MKKLLATVLIIGIMVLPACTVRQDGNQDIPVISGLEQNNIGTKTKNPTDEGWEMDESGRFSYLEHTISDNKRPYVDPAIEYNDNYFMYRVFRFDEYIYGYMDKEFNILSEPISYAPAIFQNGFAVITGKNSGKTIDTEFNEVETYLEQYAIAGSNLVKVEKRLVPDDDFEYLKSIDELLVPVADNGATISWEAGEDARWGYMLFRDVYLGTPGKAAEYIIKPAYDETRLFEEGLGAVCLNGKWGFINAEGNMLIEPIYDAVMDFKYGAVGVMTIEDIAGTPQGRWALVDEEGNLLTDFVYTGMMYFKDGLYIASKPRVSFDGIKFSEYVYLRADGKELFTDMISEFRGYKGDVPYMHRGGSTFYDMEGNRLFDEEYFLTSGFFEGYAAVMKDYLSTSWGYIDLTGAMVIEDKFTIAGNFDNGYAFVRDSMSKSWYLIDVHGNPYLEDLKLKGITRFNTDGYALAYADVLTQKDITDATGTTYQVQEQKTFYYMIHIEPSPSQ